MRIKKYKNGKLITPRYVHDTQKENDNPHCEKKNFTYEPEVSMCNKCEVNNCSDRAFNE